ncbi:hypothetical protein CJF30_00002441 [Rutstroemia sp. NJR-2017a BBW]|nr:hypothetical protein CJF30_00002441 [Rutstroemia sp. NJR-2017a BBW]
MSPKRKVGVILIFFSGAMLSEMLVGVICACMPAATHTARQGNKLLRLISISFESIRSTSHRSKNNSRSSKIHVSSAHESGSEFALKSTDRKYAHYFNLDTLASNGTTIQNTGTSTATVISSHNYGEEIPGIQRQFDVDIERG